MKFTSLLKAATTVAFASVLVACGNSSSSSSSVTEVEFFSQKPEMQATLQEIVDDYNKSQDEVKVKLTSVPDAGTVLKTRIANGEAPDVINIYPASLVVDVFHHTQPVMPVAVVPVARMREVSSG